MHCAARESGGGLDEVLKKDIEDYQSLEARQGSKGMKEIKMSEYRQCERPYHDDGTVSLAWATAPTKEDQDRTLRLALRRVL